MVKVIWSEFALGDLKSIHDYISRDSKGYADKFIEKVYNRVDQLETFPESGRIVPEFDMETIRELIEGNYRIVCKINPDHIGIVRIHHSARQLRVDQVPAAYKRVYSMVGFDLMERLHNSTHERTCSVHPF